MQVRKILFHERYLPHVSDQGLTVGATLPTPESHQMMYSIFEANDAWYHGPCRVPSWLLAPVYSLHHWIVECPYQFQGFHSLDSGYLLSDGHLPISRLPLLTRAPC